MVPAFAKPHFKASAAAGAQASFTPPQVADLYGLRPAQTAKQMTVAVIELGGAFGQADYDAAMQAWNIADAPPVTCVSVDGTSQTSDPNIDPEVMLDVEIIAAIGAGAIKEIRVYFCPNTEQGFLDGIRQAIVDGCDIGSISWGQAEDQWNDLGAFEDAFAGATSMSWWVAAGDNGAHDGTGADIADGPSICPHAGACGGLGMIGTPGSVKMWPWNDGRRGGATGGAISKIFGLPTWQIGLLALVNQPHAAPIPTPLPMRSSCDVSGLADERTGWEIFVLGQQMVVGGTSCVAPLWAGLTARYGLEGFLLDKLYAQEKLATDIVPVPGHAPGNGGYHTGPGWDVPSGLGAPNDALLAAIA